VSPSPPALAERRRATRCHFRLFIDVLRKIWPRVTGKIGFAALNREALKPDLGKTRLYVKHRRAGPRITRPPRYTYGGCQGLGLQGSRVGCEASDV